MLWLFPEQWAQHAYLEDKPPLQYMEQHDGTGGGVYSYKEGLSVTCKVTGD